MRTLVTVTSMLALAISWAAPALAQNTATASVSATIPSSATISLTTDSNSVGGTSAVSFTVLDSADMTGGTASLMYAPKRSLGTAKNWHMLMVQCTDARSLSYIVQAGGASVIASGIRVKLGSGPNGATGYGAPGWIQDFPAGWSAAVPVLYQLVIGGASSGTYNATVQYTLGVQI